MVVVGDVFDVYCCLFGGCDVGSVVVVGDFGGVGLVVC